MSAPAVGWMDQSCATCRHAHLFHEKLPGLCAVAPQLPIHAWITCSCWEAKPEKGGATVKFEPNSEDGPRNHQ